MRITPRAGSGRGPLVVTEYNNVRLTGKSLYYPDVLLYTGDELIQPLLETTQSTGVSTTDETEFGVSLEGETTRIPEPVFFFIYNSENYFHYLYDAIPTLHEYLRLRDTTPALRLLMSPRHSYPYILDCLALLGISPTDIVYASTSVLYSRILVSSSPTHEGCSNEPPRPEIWDVYARMKRRALENPIETPKKFYVSRRSWVHGDMSNMGTNYTTRRKMLCEDELVSRLAERGYVEVFCENLTMSEKIQYFANATHVVGAIGGGMCNLVFSPTTTRVTTICSPEFETINRRFLFTMSHTNLTIFRDTVPASNLYRRVRADRILGEVIHETESTLILALGNGVAWTVDEGTPQEIQKSAAVYLDNGLNSPWYFDVTECMKNIQ